MRTYTNETRKELATFFKNCIRAVDRGLINDPGDLGTVAFYLREMAVMFERGTYFSSEIADWFNEADSHPQMEMDGTHPLLDMLKRHMKESFDPSYPPSDQTVWNPDAVKPDGYDRRYSWVRRSITALDAADEVTKRVTC